MICIWKARNLMEPPSMRETKDSKFVWLSNLLKCTPITESLWQCILDGSILQLLERLCLISTRSSKIVLKAKTKEQTQLYIFRRFHLRSWRMPNFTMIDKLLISIWLFHVLVTQIKKPNAWWNVFNNWRPTKRLDCEFIFTMFFIYFENYAKALELIWKFLFVKVNKTKW